MITSTYTYMYFMYTFMYLLATTSAGMELLLTTEHLLMT